MKNRRLRSSLMMVALAAFLAAPAARASMVTYYLNQSNVETVYPDGTDYAKVVIEDVGSDIRFTVSVLPGIFAADSNFGIQSFGFNVISGGPTLTSSNFLLPSSDWGVGNGSGCGGNQDGFGDFACVVSGKGNVRADPLVFSITGVSGDLLSTYFDLSSNNSGQGNQYFALHIAGFTPPVGTNVDSGFFAGGYQHRDVVPLPAAAWLLLSGVAGLGAMARRRKVAAEA